MTMSIFVSEKDQFRLTTQNKLSSGRQSCFLSSYHPPEASSLQEAVRPWERRCRVLKIVITALESNHDFVCVLYFPVLVL